MFEAHGAGNVQVKDASVVVGLRRQKNVQKETARSNVNVEEKGAKSESETVD